MNQQTMLCFWMREVIKRCEAQGGRITSQEIAHTAACAGRFGLGPDLVGALKKCQWICIEVVGEETNRWNRPTKFYRVTKREGKEAAAAG